MRKLGLAAAAVSLCAAQEITLRTGTKEVAVPFVVFDQKGFVQGCPSKEALTVRENGQLVPVRGVQVVEGESIALGLVLQVGYLQLSKRDDARVAFALARDVLNDGDGCVAVNATGFWSWDRSHAGVAKTRQSDIAAGRPGCLPLLQDLADRLAIYLHHGDVNGYVGYTWAGVRRALLDLDRDPRLRKAVIVFGDGEDWDNYHVPRSLTKEATNRMIPVYSLYFPPEDRSDPKVQAKYRELAGIYRISPVP